VTVLWILGAFLLFMAIIWSVQAADDYASVRYGYAPFALPNVLFMLVPNGLLLFAVRDGGQEGLFVTLAGAAMLGMLLLIRSRTSGWIALFAAPAMLICAPVLLFSLLFRVLARANDIERD